MKAAAIIIIGVLSFIKVGAQWDNIPLKSKLYYSGFSYNGKLIEKKGDQSAVDTISKQPIPLFVIEIDTIIDLSNNRKLIVFSDCIDSLFLHYKNIIVKGNFYNLPKNEHGLAKYNMYKAMPEQEKATIIYQNSTAFYTLTVPRTFINAYLKSQSSISELNTAILNIKTSTTWKIPQLEDSYLFFKSLSIPIEPFIELNKKYKQNANSDEQTDFYIYNRPLIEANNPLYKKMDLYAKTEEWVDREIGLTSKYGIVESDYELNIRNTDKIIGSIIKLIYAR